MGVTGLWRLIEPAGKPVPVETLENKVLAVDISIWLHQMVKGYQDAKGAPLPNAHLMGLFQRLCKLLYFRIKPVFVFDGGFPDLKKETIAKRQDSQAKYHSESERLKRELALLLSKKTAVSSLLGKQISPSKKGNVADIRDDDMFKLPALPEKVVESESESDDEESSGSIIDLHSVDVQSDEFKNMPVKDKYDLLIELKETRKMNSWGRLHELPKKSDNFSDFQMQRLLKRRKVQECLEETEKEMGDVGMSLNDLESLLNEEGIDTKIEDLPTRRIASDNTTRFLMINNVKQALAEAKKRKEAAEKCQENKIKEITSEDENKNSIKKDELEEDLEKAIKMSLASGSEADISTSKTDDSWTSINETSEYSDSEDDDGYAEPDMSSAKAYIMQYTDLTHKAIDEMVSRNKSVKNKPKAPDIDKILEELNNEKSIIVDNVDLSSSDDDCIPDSTDVDNNIEATIIVSRSIRTHDDDLEISSNVDATQASVVCIKDPVRDVITLDTSTESVNKIIEDEPKPGPSRVIEDETDSSEGEFEEVPDIECEEENKTKPVVEVILKTDGPPEEDDIFADVFSNKSAVHFADMANIKLEVVPEKSKEEDLKSKISLIDASSISIPNNETSPKTTISKAETSKSIYDLAIPSTSGVKVSCNKTTEKSEVPVKPLQELYAEEDDDLEKAIQMSLECVDEAEPSIDTSKMETKERDISAQQSRISNIAEKVTSNLDKNASTSKLEIKTTESVIKETVKPREPISTEQLNSMAGQLQTEEQSLLQEKGRLDRIGRNITEQMTKEAQELLQIFGIPYIVAPMEAEAQCAFLESVNLTDGTITDDSDIWLFGGRTVYKNFFNQKKHVLQFLAERIERSFNLTREQLILLALLVGSDYTTGVTGVGPVTALEILASFPFNKKQFLNESSKQARYAQIVTGLQEFKKWVRAGKRTDNTSLKKKLKNVDLTDDFPSIRVVQAYLEPNVEKSEDKFTWGEIDITVLQDYTRAKFGWSQNKLDEIINPVLKRILDRKSQRSVQDYFKRKIEFQSLEEQMSKRVKAAVHKMGPESLDQNNEQKKAIEDEAKPARKRKLTKKKSAAKGVEDDKSGPTEHKLKKYEEAEVLKGHGVTVVSKVQDGKSTIEINIPKTDKFQEVIPQREKDKQNILQNKMKAIEIFRKTKLDKKRKPQKRRAKLPKERAELSETDSD